MHISQKHISQNVLFLSKRNLEQNNRSILSSHIQIIHSMRQVSKYMGLDNIGRGPFRLLIKSASCPGTTKRELSISITRIVIEPRRTMAMIKFIFVTKVIDLIQATAKLWPENLGHNASET